VSKACLSGVSVTPAVVVAERGVDAALGGDGVRAQRVHLESTSALWLRSFTPMAARSPARPAPTTRTSVYCIFGPYPARPKISGKKTGAAMAQTATMQSTVT